jgi:hypothetical protein
MCKESPQTWEEKGEEEGEEREEEGEGEGNTLTNVTYTRYIPPSHSLHIYTPSSTPHPPHLPKKHLEDTY